MSKVNIKRLLLSILSILLINIIFLLLIYRNNNSNLVINMESPDCNNLTPQIYYSYNNKSFNEKNSIYPYSNSNNIYKFALPSLKNLKYLRFDPTKQKCHVKINSIQLIKNNWFKKEIYKFDLDLIKSYNQIKNFKKTRDNITFISIGNDPQILIKFDPRLKISENNFHIKLLLVSIIIYLILIFLLQLSKNKINDYLRTKLILYSLFLALAFIKVTYYKEHVRFIYTPDIVAHFSYVNDMKSNPTLLPKFENMYMTTNHNAGNHLGHPPLYYLFMALTYSNNVTSVQNASAMRYVNMMLFMLSMLMLLYLSFNINLSILGHFTYLSVISSIPMHAYLGAAITNDNFAFLSGIIFILALKRLYEKKDNFLTFFYLSFSIFMAYFSKLTAFLLVLFAIIYTVVYLYKNKIHIKLDKYKILIILIFVIPIILYQMHILLTYRAIVPTLNITHPKEYLHSVYYIPESKRVYKTFIEWLELYWNAIESGWFNIHSHHSFHKNSIFGFIGLLILHIFALISLFLPCKNKNSYCLIGKLSILSLFTVALIQILFGYKTHLHSGYTGGLQTRYLLPFMVGFAIMAAIFVEKFKKYFWWNIFVIVICIQAIYSDFFYFLLYYK